MNCYDVIIVGAGPSGIFCGYELLKEKPDMKVLMIEKGRSIEKRNCPKRIIKTCIGCKLCSITTGFASRRRYCKWCCDNRWRNISCERSCISCRT